MKQFADANQITYPPPQLGGMTAFGRQFALSLPNLPMLMNVLQNNIVINRSFQTIKGGYVMLCSLATKVADETVAAINALEKDLGKTLLAFQCHNLKPSDLSEAELQRIREVENKLGVSLVAVDS